MTTRESLALRNNVAGASSVARVERMNSRTLLASAAVASLLCLSSCRTAPTKPEAPEKPTKHSAAVARYMKSMEDRLGPIWYKLTKVHEDEIQLGTVETTFEIPAAGGPVRNVKVVSNTGGRMDELIA